MVPIVREGFWGKPTSTIDWCESNYEVSFFFAEFWNTLSNLVFIVPSFLEWIRLSPYKISSIHLFPLIWLTVTGLGSFFFHMTLKYEMQIWDETAMIWEGLLVLYLFLQILFPQIIFRPFIKFSIFLYGFLLTLIYLCVQKPIFFQIGFAIIHFSTQFIGWIVSKYRPSSSKLFWSAFFLNYLGFLFWNLDNYICTTLQFVKAYLPFFLHTFIHFHALWHIFAGYGSFIFVIFLIHAHLIAQEKNFKIKQDWKGLRLVR